MDGSPAPLLSIHYYTKQRKFYIFEDTSVLHFRVHNEQYDMH